MTRVIDIDDLREPVLDDFQTAALAYGETLTIDFSVESILQEARAATGLSDFGPADFRERLGLLASEWDDPEGVVVDAIIFGGRRSSTVPLVLESRNWNHGVFLGATIASERTAAAEGEVGEVRRDPFAMLPFLGYNLGDYLQHWLSMGDTLRVTGRLPRIFQVNWFQKGEDGSFLWPGFGENSRVLEWMVDRLEGRVAAQDSPIGLLPKSLNTEGLNLESSSIDALTSVDSAAVEADLDDAEEFLARCEDRLPVAITEELAATRIRLRS